MFSFFRQSFRQWARSGTRPVGAQKQPARRLQCEALEDRLLPSLAGGALLINSTLPKIQCQAVSASSSNGTSVAVWTEVEDSVDRDIKAQRFDADGKRIGGEILIAGGRSPQHDPSVAMDANGNFAVAWTHDYSSSDKDVHAAIFRADGTRAGNEITVATQPKNEYDPSIAMAANGNFVVTYTYQFRSYDNDVKAVLYKANGTVVRTLDVAVSSQSESRSSVAMAGDGRFAVAFVKSDDVIVQQYKKDGTIQAYNTVAGGSDQQLEPNVAMDYNGNAVVVWQEYFQKNWNIYGRAIGSTGQMGNVFTVWASAAQETLPVVAIDSATGKFVVAYKYDTGSALSTKVTEMTAAGGVIRTSTIGTGLVDPFVSLGSYRHYMTVSQSLGRRGDDPDGGVFARFGIL